jgi:hypothetical protein
MLSFDVFPVALKSNAVEDLLVSKLDQTFDHAAPFISSIVENSHTSYHSLSDPRANSENKGA